MKKQKHAYLIMAHDNPAVLTALLSCLDDARNDIYLHIDARAAGLFRQMAKWEPSHAGFTLLPSPVEVCWGDISQVEAEYRLFEAASIGGKYSRLHLLSGTDLPIKSQDFIHAFFDARPSCEFVEIWDSPAHLRDLRRKVTRRYLFTRHLRDKHSAIHHLTAPLRNAFLILQKMSGCRRACEVEFKKGPNWASITPTLCSLLLSKREWVMRRMKQTLCPDEIFLQTILWNSPLKANIYPAPAGCSPAMRRIDWQRGSPYVWQSSDEAELAAAPELFARKFADGDAELIDFVSCLAHGK